MRRELEAAENSWSSGFANWNASEVLELRTDFCRRHGLSRDREKKVNRFDQALKTLRNPERPTSRAFIVDGAGDLWKFGSSQPLDEDD
jgi:hypothetical protein